MMKILSVNVSLPINVGYDNRIVNTGIFKQPVQGPVQVQKANLEGDRQADLENHGGDDKAVYAYSYDHYPYWSKVLDKPDMKYGQFGENLTVSGLDETVTCIGDKLKIGTALFAVTQPRVPCYKLGIRVGNKQMPRLFTKSALTGFYLRVLEQSVVEAGDVVETQYQGGNVAVKKLFEAFFSYQSAGSRAVLERALEIDALSREWRAKIEQRLK